ncbi:MAG: YgeY family selenium metabolism-linked hydrolase [Oscillospiraceae bacterium]|nr:YgeY family selenium metabolism-linked hydrolase [Oscillospiraceae bacterium]
MTKEQLHKKTVELCGKLIQTPSCSGEEQAVAALTAREMRELGYDEVRIDACGNVIGCLRGKRPGARVLLDGHVDTVPVQERERWSFDPFCGTVADGKMRGRGASDMKGAVAAMIVGAAYFAEACGRDFAGEIYVAGVVYEELFEGVSARRISEVVRPDYVIIGEASDLNLKIGQRGRAEIVVETIGKPAHSSNPEKGVNAVKKMMRLLAALEDYKPRHQAHLGVAIQELTDIISYPYPGASVVPQRCVATLDRRLLVGDTPESVLAPIRAIIDRLSAEDPQFSAKVSIREESKVCYTGETIAAQRFFPAWLYAEDDDFVVNCFEALQELGDDPILTHYSFCTNGSHYAGEAHIPTVGYGPSPESLAHTIDEYVSVSQLTRAAEGYAALIAALLRTGIGER